MARLEVARLALALEQAAPGRVLARQVAPPAGELALPEVTAATVMAATATAATVVAPVVVFNRAD